MEMPRLINVAIMRNPLNWVIVTVIVLFAYTAVGATLSILNQNGDS